MTKYVTRSQWGARNPSGGSNALSSKPKGHAVHWEGTHMGSFTHDKCDDKLRSIQNYHMDSQGWSDIAYNLIACPHGYVYEGRGKGKGSAANGTSDANHNYYAICALVGEGDAQPPELTTAIKDAAEMTRDWGAGNASKGHRDFIATSCPGDTLYKAVKNGTFLEGASSEPAPTPAPKIKESVDSMVIHKQLKSGNAFYLAHDGNMVLISSDEAKSWDGPSILVNQQDDWDRMVKAWPVVK